MKKLLLLPYIFFTLTLTVYGQGGVSASDLLEIKTTTNTVRARIVSPLRLVKGDQELNFGSIVMRTNLGGTVTIDAKPNGARTFNDGANLSEISSSTEQGSSALFTFTGEVGLGYTITLPDDSEIIVYRLDAAGGALTGEKDKMNVTGFKYETPEGYTSDNLSGHTISPTVLNNSFAVGASLQVRDEQNTGIYRGTYNVTMEYQ